ncbi:MAG: beta-glucanase (GH16 family), partial [Gammaproteobacteria bacterium]
FDRAAIEFQNGLMSLSIMPIPMPAHLSFTASNKNGPQEVGHRDYRCGELQSKNEFRYGILEVRMKTPRTPSGKTNSGFVASMFTFHQSDQNLWQEIDYEVQAQFDNRFTSNLIFGKNCTNWSCTRAWGSWEAYTDVNGTHAPEKNISLKTPLDYSHSGDFHVIKIIWRPESIEWYLDGIKYRELSNDVIKSMPAGSENIGTKSQEAHVPDTYAKIMFNFWLTNNGKAFGGINTGNNYPMKAEYDWFRYYSLDGHDETFNRRPAPPFDYGYLKNRK